MVGDNFSEGWKPIIFMMCICYVYHDHLMIHVY